MKKPIPAAMMLLAVFMSCSGEEFDYSKYLAIPTAESYETIFDFTPDADPAELGYTGIADISVNASAEMVTATGADGTATITTPRFRTLDRTKNGGIVVEWKIKWMADNGSSYAERNKFWVRLQDRKGINIYTVHWKPIAVASDRNRANMFLYDSADLELNPDTQEQLLFPVGSSAQWVSYRVEIDSAGVRVYNDLTADVTCTNGSPDWSLIAPDIDVADTGGNKVSKITFEYRHLPDYYILIKDFFIAYDSDL